MHMTDLIEKKKQGQTLTQEELHFIVHGYTAGDIPDYQMSALMMAIYFRGMTPEETAQLTIEMEHSGDVVDLSPLGEHTADKHSTGGVGDKTSLVLCPMVAACGGKMAKMSGRGLGHTGGTIDKLESFPGFSTAMTPEKFLENAENVGFVIAGQTANLAPADKKMYALRDVTATVDSIPLIVSSIMAKKLASGARTIVLDVKTGSGAFMETEESAFELARQMVSVGKHAGRNMAAVVTDMDQPLGFAVGNALEVKEAISVLRGADVPDLRELCLVLGTNILVRSGLAETEEEARARLEKSIESGAALDKLAAMVRAQGGDPAAVYDTSLLPQAPVVRTVKAPCERLHRRDGSEGHRPCLHASRRRPRYEGGRDRPFRRRSARGEGRGISPYGRHARHHPRQNRSGCRRGGGRAFEVLHFLRRSARPPAVHPRRCDLILLLFKIGVTQ